MEETWQFKCNNTNTRIAHLFKSCQWTDRQFLVGVEPEQEVIKGHKLILASASPMFEAMFYGKMAERQNPIPIPDVKPKAFRMMLTYIYNENDLAINSFEDACNLYYVAKKSLLLPLGDRCVEYLNSQLIYVRYMCPTYEIALLYQETKLLKKCLELFSCNTIAILNDKSFEEVQLSTAVTIFSLDKMECTELDLFEALKKYAKAQEKIMETYNVSVNSEYLECKSVSTENSTSKDIETLDAESNAENGSELVESLEDDDQSPEDKKKSIVRTLVEKIRFLTLTPREFADGPAKSGLLTQSEVSAIFMNISSVKSDIPMPAGFSTCRETRMRAKYCQNCKYHCGH